MANPITLTIESVTDATPSAGHITVVFTYDSATAYTQPAQQTTVGEFPATNPNWSRAHRLTSAAYTIVRNASTNVAIPLTSLAAIARVLDPTLTWAPTIAATGQPVADSCQATVSTADFTVTAVSEVAMTYKWEWSADGLTSWTEIKAAGGANVVSGTTYTDYTTNKIVCTPTTTGQTGKYHRCTVTNTAGSVVSSSAILTITAAP